MGGFVNGRIGLVDGWMCDRCVNGHMDGGCLKAVRMDESF